MRTLPHRTAILMLFPGLSIAFILLTILRSGDVPFVARVDVWSIGIYSGESPFDISPDADTLNPVLTAADVTDTPAISVADPFLFGDESSWFLFFEVLNSDLEQADIAVATSDDCLEWQYQQIVLDESFHLSYPCVFKTDGQIWMIPESWESGSVRLYRAVLFPTEWVFVKILLNGQYVDTTSVHHEDRWWLFTTPRTVPRNTTLCLFSSEGLSGDWIEHPSSPIISGDANLARPAGRLLDLDGRLIRIAQADDPTYGNGVRAFQVTQLTQSGYEEQEIP